jgi:hypothetical protein
MSALNAYIDSKSPFVSLRSVAGPSPPILPGFQTNWFCQFWRSVNREGVCHYNWGPHHCWHAGCPWPQYQHCKLCPYIPSVITSLSVQQLTWQPTGAKGRSWARYPYPWRSRALCRGASWPLHDSRRHRLCGWSRWRAPWCQYWLDQSQGCCDWHHEALIWCS